MGSYGNGRFKAQVVLAGRGRAADLARLFRAHRTTIGRCPAGQVSIYIGRRARAGGRDLQICHVHVVITELLPLVP